MKSQVLILLLFISFSSIGQEKIEQFGRVSQEEITMSHYDRDPDAEAFVIYDYGDSKFIDTSEGYEIKFKRKRRIKIFNEPGLKYAQVSIPFFVENSSRKEKVKNIVAYAYNYENGRIFRTELDPSTVYEEQINDKWYIKKFAIPNVREGSIIEYSYQLETPFLFNLPDWEFQDRIPVRYSEYTVRMIPFYEYSFLSQGIDKFDLMTNEMDEEERSFGSVKRQMGTVVGNGVFFNDLIYKFGLRDVPAFRDESYITSVNDYIAKIDFQLSKINYPTGGSKEIITTWEGMIEDLINHDNFGKYIKKSQKIAKKLYKDELIEQNNNGVESTKALIEYVKKSFTWDGRFSKYASQSEKEFFESKEGTSADINLFLIALLREAGIKANPVIISTRKHGKVYPKYPFSHFFNNVIVMVEVENSAFLTDGSMPLLSFNRISPQCINGLGLQVKEGTTNWVKLDQNIQSIDQKNIIWKLDPETGNAQVDISIVSTEYDAFEYKSAFNDDTEKIIKFLKDKGLEKVERINTINYSITNTAYVIGAEAEAKIDNIEDKLIFNPLLKFPVSKNSLTQKERNYPIDFVYPYKNGYRVTISIPQGYEVENLPEEFKMNNDLASIELKNQIADKEIVIDAIYQFNKAVYGPEDYSKLKFYVEKIVDIFNEPVIFSKIKEGKTDD